MRVLAFLYQRVGMTLPAIKEVHFFGLWRNELNILPLIIKII